MRVCKCDRCGKIYEPHHERNDFFTRVIMIGEENFGLGETEAEIETTLDICESCFTSFQHWLQRWTQPEEYKEIES
jgi:hypothetical protein